MNQQKNRTSLNKNGVTRSVLDERDESAQGEMYRDTLRPSRYSSEPSKTLRSSQAKKALLPAVFSETGSKLAIAFFGTPYFSVFPLEALIEAGLAPELVVTIQDKPAGRGLFPRSSPIKTWAQEHDIPVITPEKLTTEDPEAKKLFEQKWDVFVVAGYGKLLPKTILSLPKQGTLNIHPSLLPKYRGPSPIETQILSDEPAVGVSIILLDEETDHGPVLAQESIQKKEEPFKRSELEKLLWKTGAGLLTDTLLPYISKKINPVPQQHSEATFTKKIEKEDGLSDLAGEPYANYLKFCAYEGWPGTYFFTKRKGKNIRVKITDATYTDQKLFEPLRVIPEGKREMKYSDFLRSKE